MNISELPSKSPVRVRHITLSIIRTTCDNIDQCTYTKSSLAPVSVMASTGINFNTEILFYSRRPWLLHFTGNVKITRLRCVSDLKYSEFKVLVRACDQPPFRLWQCNTVVSVFNDVKVFRWKAVVNDPITLSVFLFSDPLNSTFLLFRKLWHHPPSCQHTAVFN